MHRIVILLLILIPTSLIGSGCSKGDVNPLIPDEHCFRISELPEMNIEHGDSNRSIIGSWTLSIDPESKSLFVIENRFLKAHFNVKPYLPPPDFTLVSFDPFTGILEVDAVITNTFDIAGYDPRFIVFTDNLGSRLKNSDNWTSLHDPPYGSIINPFKAFARYEPQRIFKGNNYQLTERLQLYFPAGFEMLDFAIDVSYPYNCPEPYEIKEFIQTTLHYESGSQAIIEVEILDWQDDVDYVTLWCPSVTGSSSIHFSKLYENRWGLTVANDTGASSGNYLAVVTASSGSAQLYDVTTITVSNNEGNDVLDWSLSWGGVSDDTANCIAIDSEGNLYVAGTYRETVDFNPGEGSDEHTANNSIDLYLSKFDLHGNHIWTKTWGGPQVDDIGAIAIDKNDFIYVTGTFSIEIDLDPGPDIDYYHVVGNYAHDPFLSKFDSDGNYIWGVKWGGEKNEFVYGLGFDLYNHPVVTGSFWITADFDPGPGEQIRESNGRMDAFMLVLNENGEYLLVYTWGGAGQDRCNGIISDDQDNIYVIGDFEYSVDLNPTSGQDWHTSHGLADSFIVKIDTQAEFVTAKSWGGSGLDIARSVGIDSFGNLRVGGYFENTVDFDPGSGTAYRISNGALDAYLLKLDSDCSFVAAATWGGLGNDQVFDLHTDTSGITYLAGTFQNTVNFNPDGISQWLSSHGGYDAFLVQFDNGLNFQSVISAGGTLDAYGFGVLFDGFESVYTVGSFEGLVDFDPGHKVEAKLSNGHSDAYMIKTNF